MRFAKVEHWANNFNFRSGDGNGVELKVRQEKSRALPSKARRLRDFGYADVFWLQGGVGGDGHCGWRVAAYMVAVL